MENAAGACFTRFALVGARARARECGASANSIQDGSDAVGVRERVSASHVALFTHTIDRAYESQTVKGGGVAIRRTLIRYPQTGSWSPYCSTEISKSQMN